jgi:hypothetical protein
MPKKISRGAREAAHKRKLFKRNINYTIKPIKITRGIGVTYIRYKQYKGIVDVSLENGEWGISYDDGFFAYNLWSASENFICINTDRHKPTDKKWLIEDYDYEVKVFENEESKAEKPEELMEPKVTKSIPEATLEYYRKDKILKIPFDNDEIRIFIKNENLEYIRNNKKIVKVFPLNKEIHFYGIKPEIRRFIVTPRGAWPINQK